MIIQAQADCPHLNEIINDLKSSNSKHKVHYVLKNDILYKIKPLYGNEIHYRLCLPAYLAEAILANHHLRQSHHFNVQQTKQYFNSSFYALNLDKIVSKIVKSCTICQLCRNTYKRQFIGESRTFGSDVSPGRVLCSDICYMPRDTVTGHKYLALYVDRLTSYVCGVPLKTLDSNAVRNSFYEYLCHFPPP